ncbi:N-acylneuraminate cytidylyltransferase-like [Branchiostoma floridae]|uniref:N-acylneuraminate cytidylyltransferase-like n=1 Tax=Branchiostoma floridae TaxID=7739 RepID=A0A9J7NBR4_BRAFL|nr:N-acylneuraminate cytidylyltransferase-like [Branchiostoma floridae]XP_035698572.1 N-acylneuraminate cytidylyltransferase-like [Branchiostoma floridae]
MFPEDSDEPSVELGEETEIGSAVGYNFAHWKCLKLLAVNADGVLFSPEALQGPAGQHLRTYHSRDVVGVRMLRRTGVQVLLLSEEEDPVFNTLAEREKFSLRQNCKDKLDELDSYRQQLGLSWAEVGYVGHDVSDVECMRRTGVSACADDSDSMVQRIACFVSHYAGAKGALREFTDQVVELNKMGPKTDTEVEVIR